MTEKSILQRIVDEDGSCHWAKPKICELCPLSRLKTRKDGSYASCVESLSADGIPEPDADVIYKAAAEQALLNLGMHGILTDDGEV